MMQFIGSKRAQPYPKKKVSLPQAQGEPKITQLSCN